MRCFLPADAARDGAGRPGKGRGLALTDGCRDLWVRPRRPGLPGAPLPRGRGRPPVPHFSGVARSSAAARWPLPGSLCPRGALRAVLRPRPRGPRRPPAGRPASFPARSRAPGRLRPQVCGCVSGRWRREGTRGREASAVGRGVSGVPPNGPRPPGARGPPRRAVQSGGAVRAPGRLGAPGWGTRRTFARRELRGRGRQVGSEEVCRGRGRVRRPLLAPAAPAWSVPASAAARLYPARASPLTWAAAAGPSASAGDTRSCGAGVRWDAE